MCKWNQQPFLLTFSILAITALLASCSPFSSFGAGTSPEASPTPTELAGGIAAATPESNNPCANVGGSLEMQLLIGPSEAVGLSPYTFATIPFQVIQEGNLYLVEGSGPVEYYEDILTADWGSFAVTFEGETTVTGECVAADGTGSISVLIEMIGQQTVVVTVEGVEHTYPWEGSPTVEASFPLTEGAEVNGEGWSLILHLN